MKALAELIKPFLHDESVAFMLETFSRAVNDPTKSWRDLYDIRDRLATIFGNGFQARKQLDISQDTWSRLGQLTNEEPLWRGRHKGWHDPKDLRDATEAELSDAFNIAGKMIEAYCKWRRERDSNPR